MTSTNLGFRPHPSHWHPGASHKWFKNFLNFPFRHWWTSGPCGPTQTTSSNS